jgi:hypothetical protein
VGKFFIPGIDDDPRVIERVYGDMRKQVELEVGSRPHGRRIAKLWTRRGHTDCMTEVGLSDPLRGGTVMAIFDMGHHRPYVVWWRPADGTTTGVREIIDQKAYAVVEFDS